MLTRRVGAQHIEAVEDAVQSALVAALEAWAVSGLPDKPSAWLFQVARHKLVGNLRQGARRRVLLEQNASAHLSPESCIEVQLPGDVNDDVLRMLFLCCDTTVPKPSQLVFALKTLCGFDVREIAIRLFMSEANVYKRLTRAKTCLRQAPPAWFVETELEPGQLAERLIAVHNVLYLLFTEGYLSSHEQLAIRQELCEEALRLAGVLAEHPVGQVPETFALLALMHLHKARLAARQDAAGGLLLLEEQERQLWDQEEIQRGLEYLALSAQGETFSRFHAEAGIAAEHCLSASFELTCWKRIVECYELLEQLAPSSLHRLNRAVAVAEWQGPQAGLAVLEGFTPPTWLVGSYQWSAVLADLHWRLGQPSAAERYRELALNSAPSPPVKRLLLRRLSW